MDKQNYYLVNLLLISLKYSELKKLRDDGLLIPGYHYRITDYVTTTVQALTKSAGNAFDVIVLAVSENELSHTARAIQHEGDTYFDGNDLGAWELWYDLDNDTEKYEWADATNGKGVIYRMIDEKRNDCPYDFKNMLFYNDKYTNSTTTDKYYYTFSYVVNRTLYDGTVEKQVAFCHSNSMRMYIYGKHSQTLNRNVFRNTSFKAHCHSNTFGSHCYFNTFGDVCYLNTFGDNCNSNTFEGGCTHNTFGFSCYANNFKDNCWFNTFGASCYGNTLGQNCRYNIFRDSCGSNTLDGYCMYNTFESVCQYNTLGYQCQYNSFGYKCEGNTFKNYCQRRHLDHDKTSITLNEEYYDDGSGKLVPVKHPDLSTQPSILPYKFMGQYVYEQLIPKSAISHHGSFSTSLLNVHCSKILFLEVTVVTEGTSSYHSEVYGIIGGGDTYSIRANGETAYDFEYPYLRVVYTSMPEEGGGYYGYNNY